jgi:phosphohistidine phosphatase SixA
MRHAKSSWGSDAPTDHARPLNQRGRRDALRIAQNLVDLGWQPVLVLSSDSQRTRETFELMRDAFIEDVQVQFLSSLYHGGAEELLRALVGLPDDLSAVMALGHNPGWEEAVKRLTGTHVQMTTANAILLNGTGTSWREAVTENSSWSIDTVLRPKEP